MQRPFAGASIEELEFAFEKAKALSDNATLFAIAAELSHRNTARAKRLAIRISSGDPQTGFDFGDVPPRPVGSESKSGAVSTADQLRPIRPAKSSTGRNRFSPTEEQALAIEAFRWGGTLKINAFAGSGKTSTLQLLAEHVPRSGLYLAFNKNIVRDSVGKFPKSVSCKTIHGLAYSAIAPAYRGNGRKLAGKITANHVVEILDLKDLALGEQSKLSARSMGHMVLGAVRRFCQSADAEILFSHVPRHGQLLACPESVWRAVGVEAANYARMLWDRMRSQEDATPLGHDGYQKLWALSNPVILADHIFVDESQDTNPVVLDVLLKQSAQMVYVGDKYQQIYEWRGAVNAMDKVVTDHTSYLTRSFRFGSAFAEAASNVLKRLGEKRPLRGDERIDSHFENIAQGTILTRTNATAIAEIVDALDREQKPCLVGGIQEAMEMLRGVQDLKAGQPSAVPDFFGFSTWNEVVEFSRSEEGENLMTFVNLVETRGEKQLLWALSRTVLEERADVVISTAHKSKGREWDAVRLTDDFFRSRPTKDSNTIEADRKDSAEELRLLYVAITRARYRMEVPASISAFLSPPKQKSQSPAPWAPAKRRKS